VGVASADTKPCELFRYKNEQGIETMSNSVPADLAHNGYSCIAKDGVVIYAVAPELTPEEMVECKHELEAMEAAEKAKAAQARRDRELLKLYPSAQDVEQARDRKISSIDSLIVATTANVESLTLKKRHLEQQAADREREGSAPSADVLNNLRIVDTQIDDKQREIAARKVEKQQAIEQFASDIARLNYLLGATANESAPAAPAPGEAVADKCSALSKSRRGSDNGAPPGKSP